MPPLDIQRGIIYATTGNMYQISPDATLCEAERNRSLPIDHCIPSGVLFDSIIAFNLADGTILWSHRYTIDDDTNGLCSLFPPFTGGPGCPNNPGPDLDFSQAPMIFGNSVGVAQKSNIFYTFDPSGNLLWQRKLGPSGILGSWGGSTDGNTIYITSVNLYRIPYNLKNGAVIAGSSVVALDAQSGQIVWETPDPSTLAGFLAGAVATYNDIVFTGCANANGWMYALDAKSGTIVWSFQSGATVYGGPSIVEDVVYWGNGYSNGQIPPEFGVPGKQLFAFSILGL